MGHHGFKDEQVKVLASQVESMTRQVKVLAN